MFSHVKIASSETLFIALDQDLALSFVDIHICCLSVSVSNREHNLLSVTRPAS